MSAPQFMNDNETTNVVAPIPEQAGSEAAKAGSGSLLQDIRGIVAEVETLVRYCSSMSDHELSEDIACLLAGVRMLHNRVALSAVDPACEPGARSEADAAWRPSAAADRCQWHRRERQSSAMSPENDMENTNDQQPGSVAAAPSSALAESAECKAIVAAAWAAGCENKDQVIGYLSRQVRDLRTPCAAKYSDEHGNRWHMLSALIMGSELVEVMAASCMDGIGVIVRWTKHERQWFAQALDTESCEWSQVEPGIEGNEIPLQPPSVWDDISQNAKLCGGQSGE